MADKRIVSGGDEIRELLRTLPETSAQHLQFVVRKNFIEHGTEVARSSRFKAFNRFQIFTRSNTGLVRFWPKEFRPRRTLAQVRAGIESWWTGLDAQAAEDGVAARIERTIGQSTNRPREKRYLLIPQGDMLSPTGKPRRIGQGGVKFQGTVRGIDGRLTTRTIRRGHKNVPVLQAGALGDTFVKEGRGGRLLLMQRLPAKKRGLHERLKFNASDGRSVFKVRATQLRRRTRILGVLKQSARQAQPLDFFASWERLRAAREARYQRMIDQIIAGQKASQAGD